MLKTGEDKCGFSVWTGSEDNFGGDKYNFPNPNGIVGWGNVDGSTGDDPVLPGKFWGSVDEFFRDTRPPLLDDFFLEVVDEKDGYCFGGTGAAVGRHGLSRASLLVTALAYAVVATAGYLY